MPSWNGQNKTRRRKPTRKQSRQQSLHRRFEMSYVQRENKRAKQLDQSVARELHEHWLDEQAEEIENDYWRNKIG